jgi:RND family efflux transporter MFP subunit
MAIMMNLLFKSAVRVGVLCIVSSHVALVYASANTNVAPSSTVAAKPALTVTTAQPKVQTLPVRLTANGTIYAWQEALIGAKINGLQLTEVLVNVGDVVKAQQVLARFDEHTVRLDLASAQATLAEAQANQKEAETNALRARQLKQTLTTQPDSTSPLSEQQIDQLLTAEKTANARLAQAKTQVALQQLRLQYTQVLAPDSGTITARNATVGAVGQPNGQELFRLIKGNRLEWRGELLASDLAVIKAKQVVEITPSGQSGATKVQPIKIQPIRGVVRQISPVVDSTTRNAIVYVDLPASALQNPLVKVGAFAQGDILIGQRTSLTVPHSAVVIRDGVNYVFTVDQAQRVVQHQVTLGQRTSQYVEIVPVAHSSLMLKSTDAVIVTGAGFLNQGDQVAVTPANTTPTKPIAPASIPPVSTSSR